MYSRIGTEIIYYEVIVVEEGNSDEDYKIEKELKDETGYLDSANFISVMKRNGRKATYCDTGLIIKGKGKKSKSFLFKISLKNKAA